MPSESDQPVTLSPRMTRRVAIVSLVGTTIEWYDFFIYGTAAALVFAPLFFPSVSPLAGTLAALATFAVGFVARPLGGGHHQGGHRGDQRDPDEIERDRRGRGRAAGGAARGRGFLSTRPIRTHTRQTGEAT